MEKENMCFPFTITFSGFEQNWNWYYIKLGSASPNTSVMSISDGFNPSGNDHEKQWTSWATANSMVWEAQLHSRAPSPAGAEGDEVKVLTLEIGDLVIKKPFRYDGVRTIPSKLVSSYCPNITRSTCRLWSSLPTWEGVRGIGGCSRKVSSTMHLRYDNLSRSDSYTTRIVSTTFSSSAWTFASCSGWVISSAIVHSADDAT